MVIIANPIYNIVFKYSKKDIRDRPEKGRLVPGNLFPQKQIIYLTLYVFPGN
jgi:hypothetical protein